MVSGTIAVSARCTAACDIKHYWLPTVLPSVEQARVSPVHMASHTSLEADRYPV